MELRINTLVFAEALVIILLSCDGKAQRRVVVRRPPPVNYGRIMTTIRNALRQEIQSVKDDFGSRLNETKYQLDDAIIDIATLKTESDELISENERLSDSLKQLTASTNAEIGSLKSQNSDLRDQVTSLQSANVETKRVLQTMDENQQEALRSLEETNSKLRGHIVIVKADKRRMDIAFQTLQREFQRNGLRSLGSSNLELRDQISTLQTANTEINATLTKLVDDQASKFDLLESANSELEERIASLQETNNELNDTLMKLSVDHSQALAENPTEFGIIGNSDDEAEVLDNVPVTDEETIDFEFAPGLVEHVVENVEQPTGLAYMMQELDQKIADTKHELAEVISPPCDFVYEGNCYFSEVHYYKKTDYADAETICTSRHGTVAYPLNKEHFIQLLYHTRTKIPNGLRYVYVWIGLKQNPMTGEVTTHEMEAAPFLKWYSGQPSKGNVETGVYLYVTKDARDERQGMLDDYDGYEYHGAICRYKFPPLNDQMLAAKRGEMDWYKIHNGGQQFSYKLFLKKVSYKNAQEECSSHGASLASTGMRIPAVRREAINNVVQHGGEDTWLGLDNFETAGQWTWNDGVEATDDNTNWHQSSVSASEVHCGVLRRGSVYKFAVDNGACWLDHFYLCEKIA